VVGEYFLPWDKKPEQEALSIDVAYDRTQLVQDDIATATATIKNNLRRPRILVMVDFGDSAGIRLAERRFAEYHEKSAGQKSGRLEKFSLTATQAILYFDSFAPGRHGDAEVSVAREVSDSARTFRSRVYEYYDPEVSAVARPVQVEVKQR